MSKLIAVVSLLALLLWAPGSIAQSTSAPLFSFQRLSVGMGADWVTYRPEKILLSSDHRGEFRAILPISYNLGQYASLAASVSYGVTSEQKTYAVGIRIHLLARGKVVGQ